MIFRYADEKKINCNHYNLSYTIHGSNQRRDALSGTAMPEDPMYRSRAERDGFIAFDENRRQLSPSPLS